MLVRVSGSMGSKNRVEKRGMVLVRGFYKVGTKMTPHFRDGINVSGSRNGTFDPNFCDYAFVVLSPIMKFEINTSKPFISRVMFLGVYKIFLTSNRSE